MDLNQFTKKILGSKSYFEEEEARKFDLIKLPLLKLVLETLPFLAPTQIHQDDQWEKIAVIIQSQFPGEDLNYGGFYMKKKYEEMDNDFWKGNKLLLTEGLSRVAPNVPPIKIDVDTYFIMKLNEVDYYLYQIRKLKFYNIEVLSTITRENFLQKERERFSKDKTLVVFEKDDKSKELHDEKLAENHATPVLYKKIAYLEKENDKKDQTIKQIMEENKKLQELIHMNLTNQQQQKLEL